MINFFRSSSIAGTVLLGVLFMLVRIPAEWLGTHTFSIEIKYLALAEKIVQGNWLYLDIWDDTPPFSGLVYSFLFILFGKTILPYHILSALLVFGQAIQWNYWLIRSKMYQERNQIPAIVYLLFSCIWSDCYTLSPALMGATFLIPCLGIFITDLNEQSQDEKSFEIGIYLGLALMFYLPYLSFLVGIIVCFLLFSGTKLRDYVLLILGTFLPLALVGILFLFQNASDKYINFFVWGFLYAHIDYQTNKFSILLLLTLPTLLVLFGALGLLQTGSFTNYQSRSQQSMFVLLVCGLLSILLNTQLAVYSSTIVWCMASFFVAHLFLLFKKRFLRNALFLFFILWSVGINYLHLLWLIPPDVSTLLPYYAPKKNIEVTNKKVWILGKDWEWYLYNTACTRYFNWQLSKQYLQKTDFYDIQAEIYESLQKDLPDILVGDEKIIKNIFEKLPTFGSRYQKEKNYWKRKI